MVSSSTQRLPGFSEMVRGQTSAAGGYQNVWEFADREEVDASVGAVGWNVDGETRNREFDRFEVVENVENVEKVGRN